MREMASGLSDEAIDALGQYYAQQKAGPWHGAWSSYYRSRTPSRSEVELHETYAGFESRAHFKSRAH